MAHAYIHFLFHNAKTQSIPYVNNTVDPSVKLHAIWAGDTAKIVCQGFDDDSYNGLPIHAVTFAPAVGLIAQTFGVVVDNPVDEEDRFAVGASVVIPEIDGADVALVLGATQRPGWGLSVVVKKKTR